MSKKTIKNLKGLLKTLGSENPFMFGRSLYKNTDCGITTLFNVRVSPEKKEEFRVTIGLSDGLVVENSDQLPDDVLSFLGFDKNEIKEKNREKEGYQDILSYFNLVDAFVQRVSGRAGSGDYYRISSHALIQEQVVLTLSRTIAEIFKKIHYQSNEACSDDWLKEWGHDCTAITFEAPVEGSEVEIGPTTIAFPFTEAKLYETIDDINKEVSFYWERDNYVWLDLFLNGERITGFHQTWEGIEFDEKEKVPDDVVTALGKIEDISTPDYTNPVLVPGCEGWSYLEWLNDTTF
jgi:hypothetical protein